MSRSFHAAPATTILVLVTFFAWFAGLATQWSSALITHAAFLPERLNGLTDDNYIVPAWATPLTTMLVHAGFLHLALNMLVLGLFGRAVEPAVGTPGFALLYLLGGLAAAAGFFLVHPWGLPWIGAGGGVGAVVGAYAILFGRTRAPGKGARGRWAYIFWLCVAWTLISLLVTALFAVSWAIFYAGGVIASYFAGLMLGRLLLLFRYRKA